MRLSLNDDAVELPVPIRVRRAFERLDCKTIRDVVSHPRKDWQKLSNFGEKSLALLEEALKGHGFKLAVKRQSKRKPRMKPVQPPPSPPLPPPPPPEPEGKIINRTAPKAVLDRNKSDEVLDVAVKLVRAIQVYRQTKAEADLTLVLQHEKAMQLYFPNLSREETQRLANVLVHVGSLALRQALGMTVVIPGAQEGLEAIPKLLRDSQGRRLNVRLEDGSTAALEDSLLVLFKERSRLTATEAFDLMRNRGWAFLHKSDVRNHISLIRSCMKKSPLFHRCKAKRKTTFGRKSGYIVFRVA